MPLCPTPFPRLRFLLTVVFSAALCTACLAAPERRRESWVVKGPPAWRASRGGDAGCFQRTRVIGFSQVGAGEGGWYVAGGVFESIVDDDRWELLWHSGGGVDQWADPDYAGWSSPLVSACPGKAPPDRVVFIIGGSGSQEIEGMVESIENAIGVIRAKIPSAREIVLHPVVGGPEGEACPASDGRKVRASVSHPIIAAAIRRVVERAAVEDSGAPSETGGDMRPRIVAGFSPRLANCRGYADSIGHLKPKAARVIGREFAEDYMKRDAPCGPSALHAKAVR